MLGHWHWWSQGAGPLHSPHPGSPCRRLDAIFESCRQHLLKADGRIPEAGSLMRDSAAGKWTLLRKEKAYSAEHGGAGRSAEPSRLSRQHPARWQQASTGRHWTLSNISMETHQFLCSSPWERELIPVSGLLNLDAPVRRTPAISPAARCLFFLPSSTSASHPSAQCTHFQELSAKTRAVLRQKALTAFMPFQLPTPSFSGLGPPTIEQEWIWEAEVGVKLPER